MSGIVNAIMAQHVSLNIIWSLWSLKLQMSMTVRAVSLIKHCQKHSGPRLLSLKLELSLQQKTNTNPSFSILWTSVSSLTSTATSDHYLLNAMAQQHIDCQTDRHQHQHSINHLADLLAHICQLLLQQQLNDNHHLQIAPLASSAGIELVLSSARVTAAKMYCVS